jgi:hypothetical protein
VKTTFKFDENKRDVPDGLTNGVRAEQAECGVLAASDARGESGQEVCEDAIRDLLSDLGHLCDREGLDFVKLVETAKKDWRIER